ncbi:MAG: phosphoglucosamine mutase [Planctomycetia bacterium]|nr:phosphoglucosamine mutase [Planctomycetia bacterium]
MGDLIISVSGLRGIVGQALTPEVAARYASAFGAEIPPGPVVVCRDGRASGKMLADAACGALVAAGRDVTDAGVAATPTLGVVVRQLAAAGGIQISASHNPAQYNGLKLFSAAGQVIDPDSGAKVEERFRSGDVAAATQARHSNVRALADPHEPHLRLVLAIVDVAQIRRQKFRVLLDSNHGSGALLGRRLLEALGCTATVLGAQPDGQFEHAPEPLEENLRGVCLQARDAAVDVAFCQDPDADRLAIVEGQGRYLGEEYTLALCVDHRLRQAGGRPGAVVTNCSTSRMSQDLAGKYGAAFFPSKVGEAHVVAEMKKQNALLGGEGNGGVIDPRVGYVRDSFVAMALVLEAMATRGLAVSELAAELPRYEIVKARLEMAGEAVAKAWKGLEARFADARPDRLDGLRLDWPEKWLSVRASNTEPIVRVFAEARSRADAERLCRETCDLLKKFV